MTLGPPTVTGYPGRGSNTFTVTFTGAGVCLKMGYTPNEIAIKSRDNDPQNHWVFGGTQHFQTNPSGSLKPPEVPSGNLT
jgi:hypothetical protein